MTLPVQPISYRQNVPAPQAGASCFTKQFQAAAAQQHAGKGDSSIVTRRHVDMEDAVHRRGTALAHCYIAYRLEREGLQSEYYRTDPALVSTELFERICALADEVEYRYVISFDDLCKDSHMDTEKFDVLAQELFGSGKLECLLHGTIIR